MPYPVDRTRVETGRRCDTPENIVLTVDRDLRLTSVCGRSLSAPPQAPSGWMGQSLFQVFPFLKTRPLEEVLRRVLAGGEEEEIALSFLGGATSEVICRVFPIRLRREITGAVVLILPCDTAPAAVASDYEELYRAVFERARDAICILQDAKVVLVNQAACDMLGLPREKVEGREIQSFLSPEEGERFVTQSLARQSGASLPVAFEFTVRRKDGTELTVEAVASRFVYRGQPAVLLFNRDVTWRKQAENEIWRRSRYQEMLSLLATEMWRYESLDYVLTEMAWVLGESAEVSRCYICTFAYDSQGVVVEDVHEWCAVGVESRKEQFTGIRVEESSWWWRCMCEGQVINQPEVDHLLGVTGAKSTLTFPILAGDKPWGFIEYHQCDRYRSWEEDEMHALRVAATLVSSVVERKEGEAALRRSERFLNSIIEQSPISTLITDSSGKAIRQNQACRRLLGSDLGREKLGEYSLFHDPVIRNSGYLPLVRQVFDEGKTARFTLDYESCGADEKGTAAGTARKLDITIFPIRDHAGQITNAVVQHRDVTEEHRLEEQLRHAQKMEAVGQLASGIAHDFNNLLTVIMGNLDLAMIDLASKRPVHAHLDAAAHATRRAADLIDRLLTFGRKSKMKLQPVSLNDIVSDTAKLLGRSIDPIIDVKILLAAPSPIVEADPGQLTQVLMNLCINARHAIEVQQKKEPRRKGRITIQTGYETVKQSALAEPMGGRPGRYAVLSVDDTGCGMDDATRSRIFEPFFTTKPAGKGTGLGLSTVYGIVKQHGGWIHCTSELGKGTSFRVYLPSQPEQATRAKRAGRKARAVCGGNETILVVDDEQLVRELASDILTHNGYQVVVAADGATALDLLETNGRKIGLVLLDMSMPHMSGLQTLEAILAHNPEMKVILSSGYVLDGLGFKEVPTGAKAFVHKPFRPDDLLRIVREVLDS